MENTTTESAGCMPLTDRVREQTSERINTKLDRETEARIHGLAARGDNEIARRIEELDREWDMERLLETNASALVVAGCGMSAIHSKKWLFLPAVVFSFFLQHALQGWCPPVPLFRRLGVRTRQEIDREKHALKALRGDFEGISAEPHKALESVIA
jgi:hypothetical protein